MRTPTFLRACMLVVLTLILALSLSPTAVSASKEPQAGQRYLRPRAAATPAPSSPMGQPPPLPDHPVEMNKRSQDQQRMYARQANSTSTSAPSSTSFGSGSSSVSELPTAAVTIEGQPLPTTSADPLLALMPDFAFSMPAQIVVDGINIALVCVLVIHLLFTVQYHFPLSRKNFYLQISSSLMLLVSLSVTLHIILKQLEDDSQRYPFMFPYIGIQLPPGDDSWNVPEEVFYLLMRAITTALIHITHIQFLTLLFPSALEARLILWMLGPLAIINSGMEFTALAEDDDLKTNDLGDAIRNICNSTLTLLYTTALLIWGLFVNRRRAWRAGGGTASFGGGSVGLALINTAISFTEIKYDRLWWLPNVCWTLTIWQSWLGFWWWVSSGMGIGEVEDRQERLERKRKREERKRRKLEKQKRQREEDKAAINGHAAEGYSSHHDSSSIPGLDGLRRFKDRMVTETTGSNTLTRRLRRQMGNGETNGNDRARAALEDEIELNQISIPSADEQSPRDEVADVGQEGLASVAVDGGMRRAGDAEAEAHAHIDDSRTTAGTGSGSSDTNPTASSAPGWMSNAAQRFMDRQPNFIKARFRRLRLAHVAAARRAAHEQSALREQVLNSSRVQGPGLRHMMFDRSGSLRAGMEEHGSNSDTGENGGGGAGGGEVSFGDTTLDRSVSLGARPPEESAMRPISTPQRGLNEAGRSNSTDADMMGDGRRRRRMDLVLNPTNSNQSTSIDDDTLSTRGRSSLSDSDESLSQLARRADTVASRSLASPSAGQASTDTRSNPFTNRAAVLPSSSATGATQMGTTSGSVGRAEVANAAVGGDDEWVDEHPYPTSASAIQGASAVSPVSPLSARHVSSSRRRESRPVSDGNNGNHRNASDDEESGAEGDGTSWFWRGGLKQMRLRDRTTYD